MLCAIILFLECKPHSLFLVLCACPAPRLSCSPPTHSPPKPHIHGSPHLIVTCEARTFSARLKCSSGSYFHSFAIGSVPMDTCTTLLKVFPYTPILSRERQVRALGALLTHLQSTVFALEGSGSVGVTAVRQLDASDTMRIDGMTLRLVVPGSANL